MTLPASPTVHKSSQRVLAALVLAALLGPLLAYICVTAMGVLAAAPLPGWAKASRTGMARYELLLNLLSCAMPSGLLGWALGRWLRRDARWCAALIGALALGFLALVGPENWAESGDILLHLVTSQLGLSLLLLPCLGAWLGQHWRAKRLALPLVNDPI